MVAKRSPARDCSEDSVLLLPRKKSGTMLGIEDAKNGLKLSQRIAYGLGHVMNDICSAMWFSYTLLFFEMVLKMPSSIAGLVVCVGQVVDAVASPVIGIFIDRSGTRKSWHLLGTTLVALSYSSIFSNCPWLPDNNIVDVLNNTAVLSNSWEFFSKTDIALGAIYFSFLVTVFQVGWAMVQIAHLAIIPDLTPDKNERANLTAIRYTANVAAFVFVFLVTWLILHITEGNKSSIGPADSYKFKTIVMFGVLVGGICTLLFHGILETPSKSQSESKNRSKKSLAACFQVVREYFTSFLLYQVTLVYFASKMLLSLNLVYMPLYLVEKVGSEVEYIATVPLVSYIASFIASLLMKQFRSCCSSETIYLVGVVLSIAACVWIGIGFTFTEELFGISAMLGAGSSVTGVASLCLCADLIGTDTENGAFVYSVVTAVDKLLGGFVIIVIENLKTGYFAGCSHYYQNVLAYGCGISSVLGLFGIITMYCNSGKSSKKTLNEDNSESAKN